MAEDTKPEQNEVEAHGAKQVAGVGLAAAALIGAGAAGVKLATDDDDSRNQGALVSERSADERLAKADADQDGYVTYQDLEAVGMKYDAELLKIEGIDVTAEALSAAGYKVTLELVDKERGFQLEGDTIMLKYGPDQSLDELAKGSAAEWTSKHREMDRDADGYAAADELDALSYKAYIKGELDEASHKEVPLKELEEAAVKVRLADLGDGGFAIEKDAIFLKMGIDPMVDAFIKGEKG